LRLRLDWNLTNQKKKSILNLVNFALIGQNPIQSQYQFLVWYKFKVAFRFSLRVFDL